MGICCSGSALSTDHAASKALMWGREGPCYLKIFKIFRKGASHRNFSGALHGVKGAAKGGAKLSLRLRGLPLKGTTPLPPPR